MSDFEDFFTQNLLITTRFEDYRDGIPTKTLWHSEGRLKRICGTCLEVVDLKVPVGMRCLITSAMGQIFEAEVIGFNGEMTYLMSHGTLPHMVADAKIMATGKMSEVSVGPDLTGRIMDAQGHLLDTLGPIMYTHRVAMTSIKLNPLLRALVDGPIDVGIRAINACLPIGRGQRVGIFGATGTGKTTLLSMIAKFSEIKRVVIALVGGSTQSIKEFLVHHLGEEGLRKVTLVVSSQEQPPLSCLHAVMRATSIAEYFRDQGEDVLLLVDSLSQFAEAQREIALMLGETPIRSGYPASVFSKVNQLLERAGSTQLSSGSITAVYTVSTDTDAATHPFASTLRTVLDNQIMLSTQLAEAGHYPAVDILASHNPSMQYYISQKQLTEVQNLKNLYKQQQRETSSMQNAPNHCELSAKIMDFLLQPSDVSSNYLSSAAALHHLAHNDYLAGQKGGSKPML